MKKISERILSWCENPEQEAIQQALNIEKHPCLIGNVMLMPDTHTGYGMPIGGVVALDGAICPNMVGVDIGCGMLAVQTSLKNISVEILKKIISGIRKNIPVGSIHHTEKQESIIFNNYYWNMAWSHTTVCKMEYESAKKQLGTLGGGNHFIEIQKGSDGYIWFMIHSGSRNLGYKVAKHYNKVAEDLCIKWKQHEVVKNELAFLPSGTLEFAKYLSEMDICVNFAKENRRKMAGIIKSEFEKLYLPEDVAFLNHIEIAHNYVQLEHHYGKDVYVHRKGATLARSGKLGVIPSSQGTPSYIVEGLGNEASLCSCSHGAGRRMSRAKAIATLDLETEKQSMDSKGILHSIRGVKDLDESASAYKDISVVMKEQTDLVKIITELNPLAVIKG
jgi:tRNA-splicing ligase RtcB